MKPEEYLEHLGLNSFGGGLVYATEMKKAISLYTKAIMQDLHRREGKELDPSSLPDWSMVNGPDPFLMMLRDELIPFFHEGSRARLKAVPVGHVHDLTPQGYAAPTPDGRGAVICISTGLETLLYAAITALYSTQSRFGRIDEPVNMARVYACAASKGMQAIDSIKCSQTGDMFVPLPLPSRGTALEDLHKASATCLAQLYFVVAHELSHVAAGHLRLQPLDREEPLRAEELEADHNAAGVVLNLLRSKGILTNDRRIEVLMGAVGSVFWAGEAIYDFGNLHSGRFNPYPTADDRFAIVAQEWRRELDRQHLMGADLFIRPFALISYVTRLIENDPPEAIMWLAEIARECGALEDHIQQVYTLEVAQDVASQSGNTLTAAQIGDYIDKARQQHAISSPIREVL